MVAILSPHSSLTHTVNISTVTVMDREVTKVVSAHEMIACKSCPESSAHWCMFFYILEATPTWKPIQTSRQLHSALTTHSFDQEIANSHSISTHGVSYSLWAKDILHIGKDNPLRSSHTLSGHWLFGFEHLNPPGSWKPCRKHLEDVPVAGKQHYEGTLWIVLHPILE